MVTFLIPRSFGVNEFIQMDILDERFGAACLEMMEADALAGFDEEDCLRIAFKLRLPLRVDGSLPLPVCVEAANPLAGAEFPRLRIQTVRQELDEDGGMEAFTEEDDPFDEHYAAPVYAVYGVSAEGVLEPIAERGSYASARRLLEKLLPGIGLAEEVTAFGEREKCRVPGEK